MGSFLAEAKQALRLPADRRLVVDDPEEDLLLEVVELRDIEPGGAVWLSCPAPAPAGAASGVATGAERASGGVLAHAGSAQTPSSSPASKTEISDCRRAHVR